MINLDGLITVKKYVPSDTNKTLYLFFTQGIGYTQFAELPIPYIIDMVLTNNYYIENERERYNSKG